MRARIDRLQLSRLRPPGARRQHPRRCHPEAVQTQLRRLRQRIGEPRRDEATLEAQLQAMRCLHSDSLAVSVVIVGLKDLARTGRRLPPPRHGIAAVRDPRPYRGRRLCQFTPSGIPGERPLLWSCFCRGLSSVVGAPCDDPAECGVLSPGVRCGRRFLWHLRHKDRFPPRTNARGEVLLVQYTIAGVVVCRVAFTSFRLPRKTQLPIGRYKSTDLVDDVIVIICVLAAVTVVMAGAIYLESKFGQSSPVGCCGDCLRVPSVHLHLHHRLPRLGEIGSSPKGQSNPGTTSH